RPSASSASWTSTLGQRSAWTRRIAASSGHGRSNQPHSRSSPASTGGSSFSIVASAAACSAGSQVWSRALGQRSQLHAIGRPPNVELVSRLDAPCYRGIKERQTERRLWG